MCGRGEIRDWAGREFGIGRARDLRRLEGLGTGFRRGWEARKSSAGVIVPERPIACQRPPEELLGA